MTSQKRLIFIVLPLLLAALACTCNSEEFFLVPTPTVPPTTPVPAPVLVATPTPLPKESIAEVDAEDAMLINLYQRSNPGVVYIQVLVEEEEMRIPLGSGSGFVIDTEGHIITNNHVVKDADVVKVTFSDGSVSDDAQVMGQDPYSDLAVIKVDAIPEGLAPLELGDSSTLQVGQRVIAIGNPFGLEGTMTTGIISALGRTLPAQVIEMAGFSNPEIIQTDAAINPGNSGGPLLDTRGRVVGINTAIRSATGVNSGIGFAVPVNTLKHIVPHLIEEGTYHYPYLGITSDNRFSVAELAQPLELPVAYGVLISEVQPETAAARAGLRGGDHEIQVMGTTIRAGGDIIIAIDGHSLLTFDDLIAYLVRETKVGQEVVLTVMRGAEELEIAVTLGERP